MYLKVVQSENLYFLTFGDWCFVCLVRRIRNIDGFFVLVDEQKGITMMTTLLSNETSGSQKVQDTAF